MLMFIQFLVFLVPILLSVAFLTLLERKVLGYMQFRKGPNVVGVYGILQPFADALKLFIKEVTKPSSASSFIYYFSPFLFILIGLFLWGMVPVPYSNYNVNLGLLFILSVSSLSVYSLLGAGWASNSKYALLGGLRAVAQVISYEISLGLILLSLVLWVGSFSLSDFLESQYLCLFVFGHFPLFLMWFVSSLAETNRSPFDLTEGESELVSGYNVEYSGGPFALFFVAEYSNIIFMNFLSVLLFLSSSLEGVLGFSVFFFKVMGLVFLFLWVRASFPRFRYDNLMYLTWKGFLPVSVGLLCFNCVLVGLLGVSSLVV
nr:NADH dehydrogenase subunit 1 [Euapta godeffroyi]